MQNLSCISIKWDVQVCEYTWFVLTEHKNVDCTTTQQDKYLALAVILTPKICLFFI